VKNEPILVISVCRILKKFDAQVFMPLSTTPEKNVTAFTLSNAEIVHLTKLYYFFDKVDGFENSRL